MRLKEEIADLKAQKDQIDRNSRIANAHESRWGFHPINRVRYQKIRNRDGQVISSPDMSSCPPPPSPFLRLHSRHVNCTFFRSCLPPRDTGLMWSTVGKERFIGEF